MVSKVGGKVGHCFPFNLPWPGIRLYPILDIPAVRCYCEFKYNLFVRMLFDLGGGADVSGPQNTATSFLF